MDKALLMALDRAQAAVGMVMDELIPGSPAWMNLVEGLHEVVTAKQRVLALQIEEQQDELSQRARQHERGSK